jgi:hypothetical protein
MDQSRVRNGFFKAMGTECAESHRDKSFAKLASCPFPGREEGEKGKRRSKTIHKRSSGRRSVDMGLALFSKQEGTKGRLP